jgi:mannose-6-phosphate isomerase-like protein (cupin superfamily)
MEIQKLEALVRFSREKMQKVALFDSPRCFCDLYCLEPGQDQRVHSHADSDKIYIVLAGRGLFTIGPEEREVGQGEAVIARAGEPHGVKNPAEERLTLLVFMSPKPQ